MGQENFGGGKSALLSTGDAFKRELRKEQSGVDFSAVTELFAVVCQLGGQQG